MDYRKFYIVNSLGNKYDLTDKNSKVFLNAPNGFGFDRSFTSLKVGNSELVTSQQFNLTDITGSLLFYNNTNGSKYEDYQNFVQFIKYKPLEFHYQTPNILSSYYCDVLLTQLTKGEVNTEGILEVPIVMHRLTEWLDDTAYTVTLTNASSGEGKYYPLVRPYHYAGTDLSNTPIYNNGTDDIGFILEINGECQNPQFSITQRGEQYGICKINGTYDYVMLDSVERTESMYLERNGSAITNPEQYQDFTIRNGASYLTWCKFRVGESIFNLTMGNIETFDGYVTIRFKNSYATC